MPHKMGWIHDLPDHRDHLYLARPLALPDSVDLRPGCPPVWDQLSLGSCTAQAIAAALEFDRKKQGLQPDFTPSRLFIYWCERSIEHTLNSDSGAQIRDGIKSVAKWGVPPEPEWSYDLAKFMVRPPEKCWVDAKLDRAVSYQRVQQNLTQMQACLASGNPFIAGIAVYESFESDQVAQTGMVPMPNHDEQLLGGHAILICGYNMAKKVFTFRNSWGDGWADKGYGYLPFGYLLDKGLSDDFWTIKLVG